MGTFLQDAGVIPSGPQALLGLRLQSNFSTPLTYTIISGIDGRFRDTKAGIEDMSSCVKTD